MHWHLTMICTHSGSVNYRMALICSPLVSMHLFLLSTMAFLSNLAGVHSMPTANSQMVLSEVNTAGFVDSLEGHLFNELSMLGDLVKGVVNGSVVLPPSANVTVTQVIKAYEETEQFVERFKEQHPVEFELIETAVIAAAVMAVAPEVAILLLRLIGFGRAGIVLETIASAIQAYLGDVKAGSLFAWLTSLAMRGYAFRSLKFMWGIKVAIASALAMFFTWLKDCLMHTAASRGGSAN